MLKSTDCFPNTPLVPEHQESNFRWLKKKIMITFKLKTIFWCKFSVLVQCCQILPSIVFCLPTVLFHFPTCLCLEGTARSCVTQMLFTSGKRLHTIILLWILIFGGCLYCISHFEVFKFHKYVVLKEQCNVFNYTKLNYHYKHTSITSGFEKYFFSAC